MSYSEGAFHSFVSEIELSNRIDSGSCYYIVDAQNGDLSKWKCPGGPHPGYALAIVFRWWQVAGKTDVKWMLGLQLCVYLTYNFRG